MSGERSRGISLLEVLIASFILLVSVLTMVAYTVMIHRASIEGKRQATASMEARALLERVKDYPPMFEQASTAAGYTETKAEYLLDGEVDPHKNEAGHRSAAQFQMEARVRHLASDIYAVTVTSTWLEDGRPRQVVLESRAVRPE